MLINDTPRLDIPRLPRLDAPPQPSPTVQELRQVQAETLASPPQHYDLLSRVLFATIDVLYGRRRSLEKFLVLEQLAPIPYRTWERLAQRTIARSRGGSALARRAMERVDDARAQHDNEQMHLLVIEELLIQHRSKPLNRFRFRLLPRLLAGPWHAFSWLLHLARPDWSYRLNATFEDHAEHEYMTYIAEHPELNHVRPQGDIAIAYGSFDSIADLLRRIGYDERTHKLESLALYTAANEARSLPRSAPSAALRPRDRGSRECPIPVAIGRNTRNRRRTRRRGGTQERSPDAR